MLGQLVCYVVRYVRLCGVLGYLVPCVMGCVRLLCYGTACIRLLLVLGYVVC
jgi:hypothetical protein